MADSSRKPRGFAAMKPEEVSRIAKMGNKAQPIEAKRLGAEHQPREAKVRGGTNSRRGSSSEAT